MGGNGKCWYLPPHDLCTRRFCLQVVFVGYVICFLQFTFREHLHNVCTISGVLYYSAAFVEVEYFDDLNALIDVLAIFEHAIWLFFFAYVQKQQVAALAIDKGPMLYRFRSGPTSGPTPRPGSQKSKISMVHNLAVLKGHHPECLKCGKILWRQGLRPDPTGGAYSGPQTPSWGLKNPASALGHSGFQPWPFGSRCLPYQIRLPKSVCTELILLPPPIIPYIMLYYKS